jgi:uncharacterized protein (DUF1499 family)
MLVPRTAELFVEAVEKVNFDRILSVGRKSDLSECAVYDYRMLGRGQETPENYPLIAVRGFFYSLVDRLRRRNHMKKALIILILLITAIIILFFILGSISKSGEAPGLVGGKLSKCPDKPNCVCSEQKDDTSHYIKPIIIPQDITVDTWLILKATIQELGGTIQTDTGNYLAATFSSAVFGFMDDLEIRIDSTQNIIHIRSASRVGYGDFSVNKNRTELLKNLFNEKIEANTDLNH